MLSSRANILANSRAGICLYCHRDAFVTLSCPHGQASHMVRSMRVQQSCLRCREPSCFDLLGCAATRDDDIITVYLPTDMIAAAANLIGKSGATNKYGTKPPNDWLQLENLVSQGKHDPDYAFALHTVGVAALIDEVQCRMAPLTWSLWLQGGVTRPKIGYAWQRVPVMAIPTSAEPTEHDDAEEIAPPDNTHSAEQAQNTTEIDNQMGAFVDNLHLQSTVVATEHGSHVQDNRTADGEVGSRTARARFPKTSEVREFLFSADAENLASAQALRDVDVGTPDLSPEQDKVFDEVVAALIKHVFTKDRVLKADRFIEKTGDVLPKNRTEAMRQQMQNDALNAGSIADVPFCTLVDAFVKKEVTKKPKPRPIVNHGNYRVWGMAKCAAIFEDILFHNLPKACIKHMEKNLKMNELFMNLDGFNSKIENDLTAFEFGIHERLKKAECDIIKHIMGFLNLDSDNTGFCHRVVDARTKACTWVLRYKDAAGAQCVMKIKLPRAMRESGDRITSSGNFLQNLLAWMTLLVKQGKAEAAIQSLIKHKGQRFQYTSARDSRVYSAFLAFEGDDTLGGLDETLLTANQGQLINEFFTNYGWKAKLKVASNKGDDCIQFVGYTALLRNGKVVTEGSNVVMFPEIKRILSDKPWSSSDIPEEEFSPTVAIYATYMANEYKYFSPMYAFFAAMREDHIKRGGQLKKSNGMLKDLYIKAHGDVGTEEEVLNNIPELEPLIEGSKAYHDLARVHAGPFRAADFAAMSGLTTLEMHGRDLSCFFPKTWLS